MRHWLLAEVYRISSYCCADALMHCIPDAKLLFYSTMLVAIILPSCTVLLLYGRYTILLHNATMVRLLYSSVAEVWHCC